VDPTEWSSEDIPKGLFSQLILKAAPAPVLMGMKARNQSFHPARGTMALFSVRLPWARARGVLQRL